MYLRQAWYQAAWSADLPAGRSLARTLLGDPVVLVRQDDGDVYALADMCPHRFAPLSAGTVRDGAIICAYHGLGFDRNGACAVNPHGTSPRSMRVRAYPVRERHDALWIWMGDPDEADEGLLPDLGFIDEAPAHGRLFGYLPTAAHYQLVSDNIMDLTHADFLHPTTLGGIIIGAKVTVSEQDEAVTITYDSTDVVPPPAFAAQLPPGARADIWTEVVWRAPGVMVLQTGARVAGTRREPEREAQTLHNVTPETETTCHYFYCATDRNAFPGFAEVLKPVLELAFTGEDKPMLEAQQRRIGTRDFWAMKPMLMKIDDGPVRARRMLARQIDAESVSAKAEPDGRAREPA